jgi:hypothetical protein
MQASRSGPCEEPVALHEHHRWHAIASVNHQAAVTEFHDHQVNHPDSRDDIDASVGTAVGASRDERLPDLRSRRGAAVNTTQADWSPTWASLSSLSTGARTRDAPIWSPERFVVVIVDKVCCD